MSLGRLPYTENGFFESDLTPTVKYAISIPSASVLTTRPTIYSPTNLCDLITFTVVSERNDQRDAFHFSWVN